MQWMNRYTIAKMQLSMHLNDTIILNYLINNTLKWYHISSSTYSKALYLYIFPSFILSFVTVTAKTFLYMWRCVAGIQNSIKEGYQKTRFTHCMFMCVILHNERYVPVQTMSWCPQEAMLNGRNARHFHCSPFHSKQEHACENSRETNYKSWNSKHACRTVPFVAQQRVQKEAARRNMAAAGYGCYSVPNSVHYVIITRIIILVMYSHYHNSRHKQIIYTSTGNSHKIWEYKEKKKKWLEKQKQINTRILNCTGNHVRNELYTVMRPSKTYRPNFLRPIAYLLYTKRKCHIFLLLHMPWKPANAPLGTMSSRLKQTRIEKYTPQKPQRRKTKANGTCMQAQVKLKKPQDGNRSE